jgi:hypothetical protein
LISDWTKQTWAKLQSMPSNEVAWEILEEAGKELICLVVAEVAAEERDAVVTEPDAEEDRS